MKDVILWKCMFKRKCNTWTLLPRVLWGGKKLYERHEIEFCCLL